MGIGTKVSALSKAATSGAVNKVKSLGIGGAFHVGVEAVQSTLAVNQRLDQGDTLFSAVTKEAVQTALYMSPYTAPFMYAKDIGQMAYGGTKAAYAFRRQRHDQYNSMREAAYSNVVGGNYMDTNAALTMRQAAVQQIQGNKLNARSALGGEARILSRNMPYSR